MKRSILTVLLATFAFGFSGGALSTGWIEFEVSGNDITVIHRDAEVNCCFRFVSRVELEGSVLDVMEKLVGGTCCCICMMDLTTTIRDLEPGSYTVRVWDWSGTELFDEADLEVPGRKVGNEDQDPEFEYGQSTCQPYVPLQYALEK